MPSKKLKRSKTSKKSLTLKKSKQKFSFFSQIKKVFLVISPFILGALIISVIYGLSYHSTKQVKGASIIIPCSSKGALNPKCKLRPTLTVVPTIIKTPTGNLNVSIVNSTNRYSSLPAGNTIIILNKNNSTGKQIGSITAGSGGWADNNISATTYSVLAYTSNGYHFSFGVCTNTSSMNCPIPTSYVGSSTILDGGLGYFPSVLANKTTFVFIKISK